MLLSRRHRDNENALADLTSIHNYYEKMVTDTLLNSSGRAATDSDFMADVSCVALNHLPPKYIRHDVDMTFFMSPTELHETTEKVKQAVANAIDYVSSREKIAPVQDAVQ